MYLQHNSEAIGVAAIGSMTAAIKAQRALARVSLTVEIVSLSPEETKRGCAYGLSYPLAKEAAIRSALRSAQIPVSQYLRKGGHEF